MKQDMFIVCLDLEGVIIPEVWHEVAKQTDNKDFLVTTREMPNLQELFSYRLKILNSNKIRLEDIQNIIATMSPLPGAIEFLNELRKKTQVMILSDIFQQFYEPFASKLNFPVIMCHSLTVDKKGFIDHFGLRLENQKQKAVESFKQLNYRIFAAGDSFNDLSMIQNADSGAFYNPPEVIKKQYPDIPVAETHGQLMHLINQFMTSEK